VVPTEIGQLRTHPSHLRQSRTSLCASISAVLGWAGISGFASYRGSGSFSAVMVSK
jgi:hypothetical protein